MLEKVYLRRSWKKKHCLLISNQYCFMNMTVFFMPVVPMVTFKKLFSWPLSCPRVQKKKKKIWQATVHFSLSQEGPKMLSLIFVLIMYIALCVLKLCLLFLRYDCFSSGGDGLYWPICLVCSPSGYLLTLTVSHRYRDTWASPSDDLMNTLSWPSQQGK